MFFYDPTMILMIPALIFAFWAQWKVKSTFSRYSEVISTRRLTAAQAARYILQQNGIHEVEIIHVSGSLTDHYDPRNKKLALSDDVYNSTSIAAIGVAAHEAGHAIQHHEGYAPIQLRNLILPVANLGSWLAFPIFFIGIFFSVSGLMDIGIIFFIGVILFHIITLPVEFNASSRAISILREGNFLNTEEITGAKKVLNAAAMTYLSSAAMAVLQLIRLLILRGNRD